MRQAIVTKFLGPTNCRGSRVKATSASGHTLTVSWDHALDSDANHIAAAKALGQEQRLRLRGQRIRCRLHDRRWPVTEIDVSLLDGEDCGLLSGSQFELGPDAGKITWTNCLALAVDNPLVTDANRQDIRDHFDEYGAWEREEIEAWSDLDLSAMVWQEGAAGVRELDDHGVEDGRIYATTKEDGSRTLTLYLGV